MKDTSSALSRRRFLQTAGLAGLAGGTLGLPLKGASTAPAAPSRTRARNLIFLVADGMCHGTLAAANHWLNLTADRDTAWMQLHREGKARAAFMETRSQSSLVTDSAAAASSWGCGRRVPNRRLNVDENDRALTPLYTYGKKAGKRLGLVTTATITHATPAGFAVNEIHRDHQPAIAEQYLERGVDLLLGGGIEYFDPAHREDGRDVFARYEAAAYTICRTREELLRAPRGRPLLGTFSKGHVPYAIDRQNDAALGARTPSLEDMTAVALASLASAPEGFLLQIEAGRVDHAAHANDTGALLQEMLEFDRCVALVNRFAAEHPDTLVIVTSDHGTGGFMVNGEGPDYSLSETAFRRVGEARRSYEALAEHPGQAELSAAEAAQFLGLPMTDAVLAALESVLPTWEGNGKLLGKTLREPLASAYACSWTTLNHSGELVPFASYGPGSGVFEGFFENWEVHHHLRKALGI
jgi:alkaline phosphatase